MPKEKINTVTETDMVMNALDAVAEAKLNPQDHIMYRVGRGEIEKLVAQGVKGKAGKMLAGFAGIGLSIFQAHKAQQEHEAQQRELRLQYERELELARQRERDNPSQGYQVPVLERGR